MEFTNYKCPVCNEYFKNGDDVVVCPECGAPHHRECYDKNGQCFYEDKHSDDFSFEELNGEESSAEDNDSEKSENTVACKNCKTENPKDAFFCTKCGYPLNECDRKNTETAQPNQQAGGNPFGQNMPPFGYGNASAPFDPMAGLKSDEPIAENVTAGEMSKFVGKNTPYYIIVFNRLKKFASSRFNFSAFIFSGAYFLYRKMTLLGVIFSLIMISLNVSTAFIQYLPEYRELLNTVYATPNGVQLFNTFSLGGTGQFTSGEIFFLYLPLIISFVRLVFMFICGMIANKTYYKHCTKKITDIKAKADGADISKQLESAGGVNLPLAISFAAAFVIISYIPLFFQL